MADFIVLAVVAILLALAGRYIWNVRKRGGCVGCAEKGGCHGCAEKGGCHGSCGHSDFSGRR